MPYEISFTELSSDAKASEDIRDWIENQSYDPSLALGGDPLELLIELEQLAYDHGFSDVHSFIEHIELLQKTSH